MKICKLENVNLRLFSISQACSKNLPTYMAKFSCNYITPTQTLATFLVKTSRSINDKYDFKCRHYHSSRIKSDLFLLGLENDNF